MPEIFGKAVANLDDGKLHVRLGAIPLREIVEAYPDLSKPTLDLLTTYLTQVDYRMRNRLPMFVLSWP